MNSLFNKIGEWIQECLCSMGFHAWRLVLANKPSNHQGEFHERLQVCTSCERVEKES